MFRQISNCMDCHAWKYQREFGRDYCTQNSFLHMLDKYVRAVDNGKVLWLLFTDLSTMYNCLSHELPIAKLHAYGFSSAALRLMLSYLTNRKQRTKINSSYSSWEELLFGISKDLYLTLYYSIYFFVISSF